MLLLWLLRRLNFIYKAYAIAFGGVFLLCRTERNIERYHSRQFMEVGAAGIEPAPSPALTIWTLITSSSTVSYAPKGETTIFPLAVVRRKIQNKERMILEPTQKKSHRNVYVAMRLYQNK